jgi:hypothetical protein
MANSGRQVLLLLWHGVSRDDVIAQSPSLADRVALRTADVTIDASAMGSPPSLGQQDADPDAA